MIKLLASIANAINLLNEWVGKSVAWLSTLLVLLFCYDVFMRYALQITSPAISELESHLFAILFLVGAGYTLKYDKHVRVDVFYAKWSAKRKAVINILGILLFLVPFCLIVIKAGVPYVRTSFLMNESSSDPGGLPARYILKSFIMIGYSFLFLQAIAMLFESFLTLLGKSGLITSKEIKSE